jgi:hypothetical protein
VADVSALLEAALDYAARGWPVLPVKPRGKDPLTRNGVKDATTNERTILHWFASRYPEANIAVATGAPGPQALDVDDPSAVPQDIAQAFDAAPHTASARGGAAFFAGTDAGTIVLGYGELRGRGSYQLVPPSVHPSGYLYTWLVEPRSRVLSPVPSGLQRDRTEAEKIASGDDGYLIPAGQRHAHLIRFAGVVRSCGCNKATVVACGLAFLRHQCEQEPAMDFARAEDQLRKAVDTWAGTYTPKEER